MNYAEILEKIYNELEPTLGEGSVANYIPELGKVTPDQLGISVCTNEGDEYTIGNAERLFSIQSISKVFSFALAYKLEKENLWKRLGREPSGNRFDSLVLLENENGIPRNPFINAGALVVTDILLQHFDNPLDEVLSFVRSISGNPNIVINRNVQESEISCADRNYALAHFMKSYNNINSNVDHLIKTYSGLCAIEMTTVDLARSFRLFSTSGCNPWTHERVLTTSQNKRINAVMMTCGLYNAVGDFAYRVGIPAKSGVGGGIVGVIPNEMSIAVWSPALDETGNSLLGIKAMEMFTTLSEKSIY
ncbi:glutaminase [Halobacteriovorax sp. HLS]|uniref:glutaminase n=1 Tax=Halobacteriovorax sp. HLS TaxID=2234000 RepID=UPI000FDB1A52|nr:glutaminase [Halobacteriovorax sp. HLS]